MFERQRHRWEDNIKSGSRNIITDWILLSWDKDKKLAVVKTVDKERVPQNAGNFLNR
jgi:hypothetical protein